MFGIFTQACYAKISAHCLNFCSLPKDMSHANEPYVQGLPGERCSLIESFKEFSPLGKIATPFKVRRPQPREDRGRAKMIYIKSSVPNSTPGGLSQNGSSRKRKAEKVSREREYHLPRYEPTRGFGGNYCLFPGDRSPCTQGPLASAVISLYYSGDSV